MGAWAVTLAYEFHFQYWWIDVLLHFAGGLWTFVLARYVASRCGLEISGRGKKIATLILFVSFVALVGVLWEWFELFYDRYVFHTGFTYLPGVFEDTLADLFFDLFGALVSFLFYFRRDPTKQVASF